MLEKLTLHPDDVSIEDVDAVRAVGVSDEAIADAAHVCSLFNTLDRLADSFDVANQTPESHAKSARYLLKHGYKLRGVLTG